jgi:hypothetical protein
MCVATFAIPPICLSLSPGRGLESAIALRRAGVHRRLSPARSPAKILLAQPKEIFPSRGLEIFAFFPKGLQAIFAFSSSPPPIFIPFSSHHTIRHGYRKEGSHPSRATGQGRQRWHGKHQSQGRELLPHRSARKAAEHLEGGQSRAQRPRSLASSRTGNGSPTLV